MNCEKCNEHIDELIEQVINITINENNLRYCRECYEDYWDEIDKK